MKALTILFALLIAETAFAVLRADPGPVRCDDGRLYQIQNRVSYVDGIPAKNGLLYFIRCSEDNACALSVESPAGSPHEYHHSAVCYRLNPQPPPPPQPQVNWYQKSCDSRGRCRWVRGYQN